MESVSDQNWFLLSCCDSCFFVFVFFFSNTTLLNIHNQINNQSIIPSTDVTQLTLTLKMTTAQVVETSVTVNNNSPIQDYVHPDDQTQPFDMTPGFKPFTYTRTVDIHKRQSAICTQIPREKLTGFFWSPST